MTAARAGVSTVTIESDHDFATALRNVLPAETCVTVLIIDIGVTEDWGYPVRIIPTDTQVKRWSNYPKSTTDAIALLPSFPELVLIDGRFRRACALHTALAVKKNGKKCQILFDDYEDRSRWQTSDDRTCGAIRTFTSIDFATNFKRCFIRSGARFSLDLLSSLLHVYIRQIASMPDRNEEYRHPDVHLRNKPHRLLPRTCPRPDKYHHRAGPPRTLR